MLFSGVSARDALLYFGTPADLEHWLRDPQVAAWIKTFQGGKDWVDLSSKERRELGLELQYDQMAYYLYSNPYTELQGADRAKADMCRQALEAKLAGNAGKVNELSQFWDDLLKGKVGAPKRAPKLMTDGPKTPQ